MKEYINKLKVLYSSLKITRTSYNKKGIRPENDWRILLITTFIILCVVSAYAVYFYIEVRDGKIFVTEKDNINNQTKLNKPLLDKIVNEIDSKNIEFLKLQNSSLGLKDPSL
jgi:hypothetical protein